MKETKQLISPAHVVPAYAGQIQHVRAGILRLMNKRKNISKSLRFSIFSRDAFTCRYCGRQSDLVPLQIDHMIPVCQGGTNDPNNLITACVDCNSGKGAKIIKQSAPTEFDRLRISQEINEQTQAANAVVEASKARKKIFQEVVNFWGSCTGQDSVDTKSAQIVTGYIHTFGASTVFRWIERAATKCPNDREMGKYISGCRRKEIAHHKIWNGGFKNQ